MKKNNYDFEGRLKKEFPSQVLVDITEVCNLGCIHCPHPDFKISQHYSAQYIDIKLNEKLVDEVKLHGKGLTQYIRYASNGEPLIHPHAFDMLDYAVQNCGTLVTLTTNGTILNEKRIRKLIKSGLHMIDVSIDAFKEETYKVIRKGGDLKVTRKNVIRLLEIIQEEKSEAKVIVSFVKQDENKDEADDFYNFWKKAGVNDVLIREQHSCSGAKEEIKFYKNSKNIERRPCVYPWERIVLNARGDLSFCPSDWVHGSFITNYKDNTIKEIWNGDFYKKLREAHLKNDFENFNFCGQCPDWQTTYWPSQEKKAYADLIERNFMDE